MIAVSLEPEWFWTSGGSVLSVVASAVLALAAVILFIRLSGLRALSKMSAFDFAVTVALGSILGSTVASSTAVVDGATAMASLLGLQWLIAQFRRRRIGAEIVDNEPVLLVRDGAFIDSALARTRVTRDDVRAKLRQANVASLDGVDAVVLETTGEISVVHGHGLATIGGVLDGVRSVEA